MEKKRTTTKATHKLCQVPTTPHPPTLALFHNGLIEFPHSQVLKVSKTLNSSRETATPTTTRTIRSSKSETKL
jgi:hypothetical protein